MKSFELHIATDPAWIETVLNDFNAFLVDHAAAEKKASGMAMSMLSHYPDKIDIVTAMVDLALEEMTHFREVLNLMKNRNLQLQADTKDPYVNALRAFSSKGREAYFLDRLLMGGIVEARGCERFGLIAEALEPGELKKFYLAITASEARHENLFIKLAHNHFDNITIEQRLNELLKEEAQIVKTLPIRAALH